MEFDGKYMRGSTGVEIIIGSVFLKVRLEKPLNNFERPQIFYLNL